MRGYTCTEEDLHQGVSRGPRGLDLLDLVVLVLGGLPPVQAEDVH